MNTPESKTNFKTYLCISKALNNCADSFKVRIQPHLFERYG